LDTAKQKTVPKQQISFAGSRWTVSLSKRDGSIRGESERRRRDALRQIGRRSGHKKSA
jgi:hypothetical protein